MIKPILQMRSLGFSQVTRPRAIAGAGLPYFRHCCPSHLQQCLVEEVLNRNLLILVKSISHVCASECRRVPELRPLTTSLSTPWVITFAPMLHSVLHRPSFCMSPIHFYFCRLSSLSSTLIHLELPLMGPLDI